MDSRVPFGVSFESQRHKLIVKVNDVFEQFRRHILKLINYSRSQKPINDLHFGQVDESWYPMKHQMKHHQVFIWDETCFSSEIKHLHFNEIFIDYTTHGNNAIPVVNNNS